MGKRRVLCECDNCNGLKMVTLETQKRHLQPDLRKKRRKSGGRLARARESFRRYLSSRASLSMRRGSAITQHEPAGGMHQMFNSSPEPPEPPVPIPSEPDAIPEIDLTHVWAQVMRAHPHTNIGGASTINSTDPADSDSVLTAGHPGSDASNPGHEGYHAATGGLSPEAQLRAGFTLDAARNAPLSITPDVLDDILSFNFIVQHKPTVRSYKAIQDAFIHKKSHGSLRSLKLVRAQMLSLSALKPIKYHCCKNSCVCYTGYLGGLQECPYCNAPRLNPAGQPYSIFSYVPAIPQVLALFRNKSTCEKLEYRANYQRSGDIDEIFGGEQYERLKRTLVEIDGKKQAYYHFQDRRELAFGLSIDGLCPFKRRKNTCWPIILINYNFPPEIRNLLENIICVGVIPGPHSPKDINSFLQPLIDELIELAKGVEAVDMLHEEVFLLRAHLLAVFGDIPAITKVLEFLGHNARFPCRFCMHEAMSGRTARGGTHMYCPLHQPDGTITDPLELPLRTHMETLEQGYEVLSTPNEHACSRLATTYGVKGVSLLARLSSISIPASFPVEVMHMVWINLIPQLVDLWTNDFNDIDNGEETYQIDSVLWALIGDLCENSGCTIPSAFGCRVPNLKKRGHFIAESWMLFATQLAPCLLRRRFAKRTYYVHFVRLITLVKMCVDRSISRDNIPVIRNGFAQWIQEYERIYYQYSADRLQTCPVNVHYLLHIADSIEFLGPVWAYWAFPMERYCSFIGASVRSRRYYSANIARRILDCAQLRVIREVYDLHDMIVLRHPRDAEDAEDEGQAVEGDRLPDYPTCALLTPRSERLTVTEPLRRKIAKHLVTAYQIPFQEAKGFVPASVMQWGRMRITGGGDLIHARGYHKLREDGRDASFVRYELEVDRLAHLPNAPHDFITRSFYGQLQHLFALPIPSNTAINPNNEPQTLLLALILEARAEVNTSCEYTVVSYEGPLSSGEVIDACNIMCAIGRVRDGNKWWIIDRSPGAE